MFNLMTRIILINSKDKMLQKVGHSGENLSCLFFFSFYLRNVWLICQTQQFFTCFSSHKANSKIQKYQSILHSKNTLNAIANKINVQNNI